PGGVQDEKLIEPADECIANSQEMVARPRGVIGGLVPSRGVPRRLAAEVEAPLGLGFGQQKTLGPPMFSVEIGRLAALEAILQTESVIQNGMNQFGQAFLHD